MGVRLALRHQASRMYAITAPVQFDYFAAQRRMYEGPLDFHVKHMASEMRVQLLESQMSFKPIDALPQITHAEIKDIEDFGIFATPLTRTEELIVDPETVDDLLARIKEMQLPEQERIRQRKKLAASREGMSIDYAPRQRFHAQILSIAA